MVQTPIYGPGTGGGGTLGDGITYVAIARVRP